MELPGQRTADAGDAGDGGPIRASSEPADLGGGRVLADNTNAKLGQDAAMLEGTNIDALLANMENELPLDEEELRKIIEGDSEVNLEENSVVEATVEENGDVSIFQEMGDDDEYDELFDDDSAKRLPTTPPSPTPHIPQVEPPALQTTPPQAAPPESLPEFDLSNLDLPTVLSNITTLKSAIINNHLLLTRFLHLQSAYRTLSTTLTKERNLLAQAQSAITHMGEEANSVSHDSPLLQFQIKQLKDEILKERATRVQCEENAQAMRTEIEKVRKEKAKLELRDKRAQETLKEGDALRGKVVGLMSENRSLTKRVEELEEQRVVRKNKELKEEIVKLKKRVVQLEGNIIRLKAGRSILAGGGGNMIADVQPSASVHTSPTTGALSTPIRLSSPQPRRIRGATSSSPTTVAPQTQYTDPIDISDNEGANQTSNEVVFVGASNIPATLEIFQTASPTTERPATATTTTATATAATRAAATTIASSPTPAATTTIIPTSPPSIQQSKHWSINSTSSTNNNRDTP